MITEWQFSFEVEKPNRLHRYFWCATIMDGQEPDMWWSDEHKQFVPHGQMGSQGGGSHSPVIRTFRAFKRFLRKHPELHGRRVRLVSRYVGHDIEASRPTPNEKATDGFEERIAELQKLIAKDENNDD